MEGLNILQLKRILFVSKHEWADPEEQHIMMELLSGANDIVWVNPFGTLRGSLLPRVTTIKESLKIYNPGVNYLPLPSLRSFADRRRYLQVSMFFLENDFEPDIVFTDDPFALSFASKFAAKGALIVYYSAEAAEEEYARRAEQKMIDTAHLIVTTSPKLANRYRETEKITLIEKYEADPADNEENEAAQEQAFMVFLNRRLETISAQIEKLSGGRGC